MRAWNEALVVNNPVQSQRWRRAGRLLTITPSSGSDAGRLAKPCMRSWTYTFLPLLLLLGVSLLTQQPRPLFAQATDGTLLGQVSDPARLPVPGVKITAQQAQ